MTKDTAAQPDDSRRVFLARMAGIVGVTGALMVPTVTGFGLTASSAESASVSSDDVLLPPAVCPADPLDGPSNTTTDPLGACHGNSPSDNGVQNGGVPSKGKGGAYNGLFNGLENSGGKSINGAITSSVNAAQPGAGGIGNPQR